MSERLQSFLDCNQLASEWELFLPVALLSAEDCIIMGVRYGIDDYSDRANNVQLNDRTP